jgi:hypothetical protein
MGGFMAAYLDGWLRGRFHRFGVDAQQRARAKELP